ncbi:MAG: NADPH-dependent FMN reductase [Pseudomonadota bacterium]
MSRFIGISGSLRNHSYHTGLLRAAAELAPAGVEIRIASIADIPLYNQDVEESSGVPAAVARLKDEIQSADGLLIASPEYNNSVPGVLKNAVDWLSRPPADIARVFRGRPVAVIGATPGALATALAQSAWLPVLRALGCQIWAGGRLGLSGAMRLFDAQGNLTDADSREALRTFIAGFAEFAAAQRR